MIGEIKLTEMKFFAFHGVMPQEKQVGNYFVVNLNFSAPLGQAMRTDDLKHTIDYAAVYRIVENEMNIPSHLLEHVAGRILYSLKNHFPQIIHIELSLSKLHPPLGGEVHSATVKLTDSR